MLRIRRHQGILLGPVWQLRDLGVVLRDADLPVADAPVEFLLLLRIGPLDLWSLTLLPLRALLRRHYRWGEIAPSDQMR